MVEKEGRETRRGMERLVGLGRVSVYSIDGVGLDCIAMVCIK